MADYEIEVGVELDSSSIHAEVERELAREERRGNSVEVDIDPKVDRRAFARAAQREVKAALRSLDAEVSLAPKVARSFRTELQRQVKAATGGRPLEVEVVPVFPRTFRTQLQRQVREGTGGARPIEVEVVARFTRSLRTQLQRQVREATAANPIEVAVAPTVSRRAVADFTRDLQVRGREAARAVEASGALDVRPRVDAARFRAEMATLSRTSGIDVPVDADTRRARTSISGLAGHVRSVLLPALALAAGGLAAIGLAFGSATKLTADFDEQLSNLQAVASTTSTELGVLREQAIKAGADTAFSASEAAEAQTELAKAGASVQQILDGGLTASLSLAAAGSLELGDAATYVATGLNTFGLEAEDASRVADVLAAAANKSAADIPDIGLAMQQVGLVAKSYNLTIEDTAGTLALFAQNGLRGSDAGTSFKTMLSSLTPTSKEAAKRMAELDLNFYNAQGQFVGIEEAAGRLREGLKDLTEEQRNEALTTIFGSDAKRAAILLYEAGAPGIREWTSAVNDSGFAADVAATKLDNLKGDLEELRGSFETAFIAAGSGGTAPLRELVQSLVPIVNDLGPKIAALLVPITELITDLGREAGPFLDAALDALTGFAELLGPVVALFFDLLTVGAEAGAELFDALEPVVEVAADVVSGFLPLIKIIAGIAAAVAKSLVPAFEALGEPEVAELLADIAEAAGDLLVELAPLLPELIDMAVVLARSLLPVLSALVPVIGAVADVLVPVVRQLAYLAPLLIVGFAFKRMIDGALALGGALKSVVGEATAVQKRLTATFGPRAGQAMFTGVSTGAAVAASAMSGYLVGGAEDAGQAIVGLGATATSVFLGFQQGGPVGGALALAAAGLGAFFGAQQKEARKAAEAQREFNNEVRAVREAFDAAGVDRYSTQAKRAAVVTERLLDVMKGGDEDAEALQFAFDELGINFEKIAAAAARGEDGVGSLRGELRRATQEKAEIISQQSLRGMEEFGGLTDVASRSLDEFLLARGRGSRAAVLGADSLQEYIAAMQEAGRNTIDVKEATEEYERILQRNLLDTPAARYIEQLPATTKAALEEQQRLAEVQRLVNEEQEKSRAGAERFSSAYSEVSESLNTATSAYTDWLRVQQGGEVELADVRLGVLDYAKSLRDLAADTEASPFEKQQRELQLVAQAQQDVAAAVGQFIRDSGGDYDAFLGQVQGLKEEIRDGLTQALGLSTAEAQALVDKVFEIPSETEFTVLADTTEAVTSMEDLRGRVETYVNANPTAVAFLNNLPAKEATAAAKAVLDDYAKTDPQAKAYLDTLDVQQKTKLANDLLNGLDGRSVTATVNVEARWNVSDRRLQELGNAGVFDDWRDGPPEFAVGGFVRRPTLALVGEAGPELVLPLNDPARVQELLGQAGLASSALALSLPSTPAPPVASTGIGAWVDDAAATMAELPGAVTAATVPGLTAWEGEASSIYGDVGQSVVDLTEMSTVDLGTWASVQVPTATLPALASWRSSVVSVLTGLRSSSVAIVASTSSSMQSSWSSGLAAMAVASSVGGRAIVDSLVTQLDAGASRLAGIARTYRNDLADALNPILSAVGAQQLRFSAGGAVERFARGGYVPGPDVNRDVVPALLMPGEVVIRKASVQQFGLGNLLDLNAGRRPGGWSIPGYAEGGTVTGDTAGLVPEFTRRLGLFSAAVGMPYRSDSGYRSLGEQARLYQRYLAGVPGQAPAAPPGRSMHNFGLASDGSRWRSLNPGMFGLRYPMSYEPWHIEPIEAREWARLGIPDDASAYLPIPPVPGGLGKGTLAQVAAAAMGYAHDRALGWAGDVSFAAPGTIRSDGSGSAGAAAASTWLRAAMAATGVPASWLPGLLTIARRESNYDPRAVNRWDSNARRGTPSKGLMQMIDPTFRAYALPGRGNIFDPVDNASAAIRYILARYGDISRVQQANPALPPRGYALGGLVEDLLTSPRLAAAASAGGSSRVGVNVDGNVNVNVTPPNSHDPEGYAAALSHRVIPMLARLAERT